MAIGMGFDFGLESPSLCLKRKNRWLFVIPNISADSSQSGGTNCLPPSKSARPNISFKEIEAQHLNETIYFPGKPDWKPVNLTLYDLKKNSTNPVFKWLQKLYDPETGKYKTSCDGFKIDQATLNLYDGCGTIIETWIYENAWPQSVEFGELDMSLSEVVTCDITLRYDRAYIQSGN